MWWFDPKNSFSSIETKEVLKRTKVEKNFVDQSKTFFVCFFLLDKIRFRAIGAPWSDGGSMWKTGRWFRSSSIGTFRISSIFFPLEKENFRFQFEIRFTSDPISTFFLIFSINCNSIDLFRFFERKFSTIDRWIKTNLVVHRVVRPLCKIKRTEKWSRRKDLWRWFSTWFFTGSSQWHS